MDIFTLSALLNTTKDPGNFIQENENEEEGVFDEKISTVGFSYINFIFQRF